MLRRINPKAIICYCEPFDEMQGNIITVDYAKTNNLSSNKEFRYLEDNREYKMLPTKMPSSLFEINRQYMVSLNETNVMTGFGGGGVGGGSNNSSIFEKIRKIVKQIKERNGSPPPGYKGGKTYRNEPVNGGQKLPSGVKYKEYDVNPYSKGVDRGPERIVIGDDGSVWYTNNHYETFTRID